MILAAREAGDLVGHGGDRKVNVEADDLEAFGISRDLAAHAVKLAT